MVMFNAIDFSYLLSLCSLASPLGSIKQLLFILQATSQKKKKKKKPPLLLLDSFQRPRLVPVLPILSLIPVPHG